MRRVLAIAMALMLAVLVLSPAMGYSLQSFSHPYSIKSVRVNYTVSSQTPSHEPAVRVTRVPFSLKYVGAVPPKTEATGPVIEGNTAAPIASANVTPVAPISAAVTPALPSVEQKLSIQGIVYDDQNGNGKMDGNETGLANWTINLEQPPGSAIFKAITNEYGEYGFYSLIPGNYTVVENLEAGWSPTMPSEGKYALNLTGNTTMLDFGNEMVPAPTMNITSPTNQTFSTSETTSINTTSQK